MLALLLAAQIAIPAGDSLKLPRVPREFRGVWVATVSNIDWPSRPGLPVAQQQDELLTILDRAQALHLNAVIFQVRPAADAMYASQLEPWSEYLTGRQGQAPSPAWDPLEFAVKEAHARGLELHAWFNPFRVLDGGPRGPLSPLNFAKKYPDAAKPYAKLLWLDPGDSRVRDHVIRVITDVVKRYDVDGVHIDDYFYPYPEHDRRGVLVQFPDDDSYNRYRRGGGTLERDDWRRDNVNQFVKSLYTAVHETKPWVKVGISPFGIWRPGYPAGVDGMDTYSELFADAKRWLNEGWADYWSPQLYWPVNTPGQDYRALLKWWGEQNTFARHLWPGNFTSRVGTRSDWPAQEVVAQVLATRADNTAMGNIHYSMHPLLTNQAGVADALYSRVYAGPALVPESSWLPGKAPPPPLLRISTVGQFGALACFSDTSRVSAEWYVLRVKRDDTWTAQILPAALRQMTLGTLKATDSVAVSSVDRTGREGAPTLGTNVRRC